MFFFRSICDQGKAMDGFFVPKLLTAYRMAIPGHLHLVGGKVSRCPGVNLPKLAHTLLNNKGVYLHEECLTNSDIFNDG